METTSVATRPGPWGQLSPALAKALRPEMERLSRIIIRTVGQEVPEYGQPLHTRPGRGLAAGVRHALTQFVELVDDPTAPQDHNISFFRRLGAGELLEGRSMDSLHAAYRVGARVACRKYIEIARAAALPNDTVMLLSEAVLAHINLMANESVKGFTSAKAYAATKPQQARLRLAERLTERVPPGAIPTTRQLATEAAWPLPRRIACVTVDAPDELGTFSPKQLGEDVLVLPRGGQTLLLLPDPTPTSVNRIRDAVVGLAAALGPTVNLPDAWQSVYYAKATLRLLERGLVDDATLVSAEEQLSNIQLLGDEKLVDLLSEHTLHCFTGLPKGRAARLEETLEALLKSWGRTAPEVATALGIHPQTARYRLRQLEELLGHRLTDPQFRFAAESALRARTLLRSRVR